MRSAILNEIYQIMHENKNVYFVTGDLGYNSLEKIETDFKERFINVGLAEQNMIGISAGLALSGKKVYVYSIVPFLIMRCYEQIRNDVCFHDLDVTLLGIGAGFLYGILSRTHFALEDIAILRPLPNISIFSPTDEAEAVSGIKYLSTFNHPVYFRIGGRTEPTIYKKPYKFNFGKGVILKEGREITIFATGVIMEDVIKAVELLSANKKIYPSLINIHTLKPIDKELIIKKARKNKLIITVEEHGIIGGLGSSVCEIVTQYCPSTKVVRIGTEDKVIKIVGTRTYLRKILGLDAIGIYNKILNNL